MSLLPIGHTLVPGSVAFDPLSTSLATPTTEVLPNYNGADHQRVGWSYLADISIVYRIVGCGQPYHKRQFQQQLCG